MFEESGLECFFAVRLEDGVDMIGKMEFDLFLVDLNLPDLIRTEVEQMRALVVVKNLEPEKPIVVHTGYFNFSFRDELLKLGAENVILKGSVDMQGLAIILHYVASQASEKKVLKKERDDLKIDLENLQRDFDELKGKAANTKNSPLIDSVEKVGKRIQRLQSLQAER
jgi:DNA-binding NarL/FixJ family response regulator